MVGSEQTGEALVLSPPRKVDAYFEAVRAQGLRLRYVLDTHGHDDYLSGLAEVTARSEVEVLGSAARHLGYAQRPVGDGDLLGGPDDAAAARVRLDAALAALAGTGR